MMVGPGICGEVAQMENLGDIKIGQRVQCNGHRGTVKYVGEVPPTKGIWLGIDWDDSSRGRHDGSHEGHKYFKTRHPTSGSFVRPEKVNFGQSCMAAIRSRYGGVENAGIDEDNWAVVQKQINARFLEMVGLDKISKIQSDNRLMLPENPIELQDAFRSLEHLIAGLLEYTWSEMMTCATMWPHIKSLQVPYNHFVVLEPSPSNVLSQLKFLDLDGNPIDSWAEINKLGKLPCLETLNVSNTGLTDIYFPTEKPDQKTDLFQALRKLCITENKISKWQSICELDKLKQLENLKIMENPLMEVENRATNRQLIIARIESLKKLNGVDVTADERRGAEYDYLKRYGKVWLELVKTQDEEQLRNFMKEHSRYPYLIQKYGAPDEGEFKVLSTTLKSKMISVELFSPNHETKRYKKMLPRSMLVQKLFGLVQKMFDTGNEFPKLTYISSKKPGVEIPLDNELKTLDFYSVEDGDQISVRW
ncbi:tubulin-specific chaperone E isoform X2 [Anabrus simplex]|uniref:tubulin-specific chaperone E isoform X2 n=1 Tax=Anabrus simplex TaxID=316456 RepID=UPI0034DD856C